MDDVISRQDAINVVEFECGEWTGLARTIVEAFEQLPSAAPKRKKGRWISADAMYHGVPFYCSECGENTRDTVMGKPRWKFCPICGSDNGSKEQEDE